MIRDEKNTDKSLKGQHRDYISWDTQLVEVVMPAEAKDDDLGVKSGLEGDTSETGVLELTPAPLQVQNN